MGRQLKAGEWSPPLLRGDHTEVFPFSGERKKGGFLRRGHWGWETPLFKGGGDTPHPHPSPSDPTARTNEGTVV